LTYRYSNINNIKEGKMKKQELVKLFENIPNEDKEGHIEGIFFDRFGGITYTDSIRLDMDGGRLIMVQQGCDNFESNNANWQQEVNFNAKKK